MQKVSVSVRHGRVFYVRLTFAHMRTQTRTHTSIHISLHPQIPVPSCSLVEHHPDAVVPVFLLKAISVYYCKHFHREYFKDNSPANYFQMVYINIFTVVRHRLQCMAADALSLDVDKCTFIHKQSYIWLHVPTEKPTDISQGSFFMIFKCTAHWNL